MLKRQTVFFEIMVFLIYLPSILDSNKLIILSQTKQAFEVLWAEQFRKIDY